jgi:hypothetical protein
MARYEWPIKSDTEYSQSSTFMPLICSVIDGFHVTFPDGYERIFDSLCVDGSPFRNFKHFQGVLKESVKKTIGNTSSKRFNDLKDGPYHLQASLQEAMIGIAKPPITAFFVSFIGQLKSKLAGKTCVLVEHQAAHEAASADIEAHERDRNPHRVLAHTTQADRRPHRPVNSKWYAMDDYGGIEDYSDAVNSQINSNKGNPTFMTKIHGDSYLIDTNAMMEENLSTKQQRVILKNPRVSPRWYYQDDSGNLTPYPDHINSEIMKTKKGEGLLINIHGIDYFINPLSKSQMNSRTGEYRPIVYEGGKTKNKKTKRRRSLCKYTRHRY